MYTNSSIIIASTIVLILTTCVSVFTLTSQAFAVLPGSDSTPCPPACFGDFLPPLPPIPPLPVVGDSVTDSIDQLFVNLLGSQQPGSSGSVGQCGMDAQGHIFCH